MTGCLSLPMYKAGKVPVRPGLKKQVVDRSDSCTLVHLIRAANIKVLVQQMTVTKLQDN